MKHMLRTLSFVVVTTLVAGQAVASETVRIGVPSWTGAQAIANLLKVVVESRIGGTAELVPAPTPRFFRRWTKAR